MRSASPSSSSADHTPEPFVPQAADAVAPQDRRAVDAQETAGIELAFEPGDRLQQQVAAPLTVVLPTCSRT